MKTPRWPLIAMVWAAASCGDVMSPDDPGVLVPLTVEEDPTLPAVELNGSRFHAQTFGDPSNPVVVFVHGGPGGDYRSLLALGERHGGYSLADDYYLVFWDQRGSGLSMRHDKDVLTIDVFASDFNAIVNHYAPGRSVYLVGESWGGMLATRYINQYPDRVAGAVLIEPGPLDGATMERLEDDLYDLDLGAEWLNDYAWSTQFLTPDDHARMDYERLLGVKDAQPRFHIRTVDPSPFWRLGAAANRYITESGQNDDGDFDYDFTTNLAAFQTPVLFLASSWNEVLGTSFQEEQMLRYPSASLEVVDGAGHDVAWVKTPEVVARIRSYLEARRGGAS